MSKTDFQNGFALGLASGGVVQVVDTTEMDALGNLIDESGVLDSAEGSVSEKVEQLIGKAEFEQLFYEWSEKIDGFSLKGWSGKTIPRINPIAATGLAYFLQRSNIEYIDFYINSEKTTTLHSAFLSCAELKWLVGINTSACKTMPSLFSNCRSLETIQEPLNFSSVTVGSSEFYNCYALKDISFVPETIKHTLSFVHSSLLSAKSIQSIIDGLSPEATGQTLTLSRNAVNTAFETSDGASDGSTSEESEWLNLVAVKPDWTITLS